MSGYRRLVLGATAHRLPVVHAGRHRDVVFRIVGLPSSPLMANQLAREEGERKLFRQIVATTKTELRKLEGRHQAYPDLKLNFAS